MRDYCAMTATTADYVSEKPKGKPFTIVDTIRLAMKLKDEFEKVDDPQMRHEAICKIIASD